MPIVTLSLARARLVEARSARPSVRRRREARRMERSGAKGERQPEHTTASDDIVKQANPFPRGLGRRDLNARRAKFAFASLFNLQ